MIWHLWWVWMAAALALAILEVFAPGFVFLGFAVGAAITGVLVLLGVKTSIAWTLVIFATLSLLAWIVSRRVLGVRKGQVKIWDTDINEQ